MNASSSVAAGKAKRHGRRAQHSTTFDLAIRLGIVSYGVVHLLIAWLALQLSWGSGDGEVSGAGALRELAQQPYGAALLWAVGIGSVALAVWQLLEAAFGHTGEDRGRRIVKRAGSAGKVLVFGVIATAAIGIASGASGGGSSEETWTARLLSMPGGQVLVVLVGLGVVVFGVVEIGMAITARFLEQLTARGQARELGTAVKVLGRAGYASKGVAFLILGGLFMWAAVTHDAEKAGGLDAALKTLLDQPFGPYLLTVVALGIGCFGVFCFVWSRHLDRSG